ncbi:hypothetical protein WAI61_17465 [Acinetobacter baumannii]|uniref:hypothetical protein n=1 Tax=Acinetobacter baumannii TaxID=470 RepID=UPI00123112B3|nr:hypothetical protein [Acinetobacter baumannii]EHU3337108.1 hypothetical protein [Acinetobacter baumannii]MDV4251460.1 hypothetical protein [Acinetobacter baumannii]MDV4290585.1 hypothetical protein [Acinetobacter baumannii]
MELTQNNLQAQIIFSLVFIWASILTLFLVLCLFFLGLYIIGIFYCNVLINIDFAKTCALTGLLWSLSGVLQLEIAGLFNKIFEYYRDKEKIPSYIVREIIDNPDTPIKTFIRNFLFKNLMFGFFLIVIGHVFQIISCFI